MSPEEKLRNAAVVVVLLGAAFTAGHLTALAPTVHETVRAVEVESSDAKARIAKLEQENETLKRDVHRVTHTVRHPDGTVERTRTEDSKTEQTRTAQATETREETAHAVTKTDTQRTLTVTSARPDWRVGVLVGGQLTGPLLPIAGPLVLGVQVDRRIAGPLWLGIWAQTGGAAGAAVSIEF